MAISINQKGFPSFTEPQLESLELILNDLKDSGDLGGGAGTAADLADMLEDAATAAPTDLARIQALVSGDDRPPGGTILFGDSRTFHHLQSSDFAAGNYRLRDNGWFTWANVLAGSGYEIVKNAGISSDSTSQMLDRYVTDVRPYAPQARYMTFLGGTNNIGVDIVSAQNALSDAIDIFELARQDNLYILCMSELPRGVAAASINWYNAGLKEYWQGRGGGEYIDLYAEFVNPSSATGSNISGVYYDGIHLDVGGGFRAGKVIAPVLARLRGAPPALISSVVDTRGNNADSNQICDHGLFLTSGGTAGSNASGVIGAGWTLSRAAGAGTIVGALVATSDGIGQAQQMTIDATGTGNNTFRLTLSAGVHARATPGKVLRIRARVKSVSQTNLHTVALRCTKTVGELACLSAVAATGFIPETYDGVYCTWRYTIPAGGETTLLPFFDIVVTGVGAAVIEVSRFEMRLTDS